MGLPCSSIGRESVCNAGNPDLIPQLGRSPGEGNVNPFQFSCLENPTDQGIIYKVWQHPCPLTTRFQYPPLPFDDNQTLLQILPNVPWQGNHRACFPKPHKKNSLSSGEFMANSIWVDNVCDWHHQLCPPNYCFIFIKRSMIGRNMLKKIPNFLSR